MAMEADGLSDDTVGVEADFLEMRPKALALGGTLKPYPGFAAWVHQNVKQGVAEVLAHEARIAAELPKFDLASARLLPRLTSALGFAARRANREAKREWSATELRDKQAAVADHRRVLLVGAEALAAGGLLPPDEVARIRKGRGFIDQANDCVDLAALFNAHQATVKTRVPFDWSRVQQAATVGTEVAGYLRPQGSTQTTELSATQKEDLRIRDALWTMVEAGHEPLWRAGAWLFGHEVDAHVPPLLSREFARKPGTTS